MSHIINDASHKQHNVTITLIDLQNAFGEVHHNLIDTVLKYHHIPDDVIKIIRSLYSDFHITILTNSFSSDFIKVEKGVLQGDCFSPLIFNMVMNTFIQYIQNQYFQQFGYQFLKHFTPRHWLQFADDAAAITRQEGENQTLLNAFDRWCTWSHMIIKVEKCHSFGMKKCKTKCEQIKPKLYLKNKLIKPVKIGESFVYLGRYFDFNMTNNDHKEILISKTNELLDTIDKLPLHLKNKIMLYQRYVLSKISWHLTIADLPITWVKQNLDNIASKFIRTWLEIPVAGTLNIIRQSKNKFGLGIILISDRFTQCQVTLRNKLKNSKNRDICEIYDITKGKNITYDQYKTT